MQTVEIIPSAAALIQSLRGLGYSPETAVADLVDNSISAGASAVDIDIDWNDGDPHLAISDDGRGLDHDMLVEAMCFGGAGPLAIRAEDDLGRFGLGLKTASLSQCRRMTVVTRREGRTTSLAWDVDEVIARRQWDAIVPDALLPSALARRLGSHSNGTIVLWERMDSIGGLSGLDKESFFIRVRDIGAHCAMVFHRYLSGDARHLAITLNGRPVRPWDPFCRSHPATIPMPSERLRHAGSTVMVKPHVLPHRDRFANDAEHEAAGGRGGWGERQGFYVYRAKRLVVAGGWLGLGGMRAWTREESVRLARIAVDLPIGADADWRIDVRKSLARPPGALRARLTAIGAACRQRAREVFSWRGHRHRPRNAPAEDKPVWLSGGTGAEPRYRISRAHPAVQAVAKRLGAEFSLLDGMLALVERSVPIERIWLDVSENEGYAVHELDPAEVAELAPQLARLVSEVPGDEPLASRLDRLLRCLPAGVTELRQSVLQLLEIDP